MREEEEEVKNEEIMNGSSSESWQLISPAMPRFRPIAPKPATCPGNPPVVSAFSAESRKKRKYVRVRRNSRYTRRSEKKPVVESAKKDVNNYNNNSDKLLQLLPERSSDLHRPIASDVSRSDQVDSSVVVVILVQARPTVSEDVHRKNARSWLVSLESDTCPGFVSDGSESVTWVNAALRKMVSNSGDGDGEQSVVVGLVIKEKFPSFYSALTGHVKLQYYNSHARERKLHSRVVPCDLWRMDGGGFAWRLDVEAALTLGRTT